MMRAVLADTGPLYAAVDPHDARHKQAIRELSKLDDEKHQVVLAYPTLLEAYTMGSLPPWQECRLNLA
jgi:predicted nucleic acid-binding protein